MDDMALAWFTQPLAVDPEAMRPVAVPPPPPPTMAAMRELMERVRHEEADNRRKVTFMCRPEDRDTVDRLIRKAAAEVIRTDGPGRVRRWKLTASSHIPPGQVLSWLDHVSTSSKAQRGAQPFPPLGIMIERR